MTLIVWDTSKNTVRRANKRDLFEAIYILTQLIPIGRVCSYKNIASVLKTNPRLIGQAMKYNDKPVIVPCHRVIYSNGDLGNYSKGGVYIKKKLLEIEGIVTLNNRVSKKYFIDLNKLLNS